MEVVLTKYSSLQEDVSKHIDKHTGFVEQFSAMDAALSRSLAGAIFVELIKLSALMPVMASIETLEEIALN